MIIKGGAILDGRSIVRAPALPAQSNPGGRFGRGVRGGVAPLRKESAKPPSELNPAVKVACFPVTVEHGQVFVELP